MTDFVALYRGRTVAEAEIVAVTAEPRIVRMLFAELLGEESNQSERTLRPVIPEEQQEGGR
jgi:hypothetical protein